MAEATAIVRQPTYASFPIWKAFKGKGGAAIFEYNNGEKNRGFYIKFMPEKPSGESFDNKAAIPFKLGANDVGEILAVLDGMKDGLGTFNTEKSQWGGLYHKSQREDGAFTSVNMQKTEKGLAVNVRRKNKDGDQRIGLGINLSEICLLKRFFEAYLPLYFRNTYKPQNQTTQATETAPVNGEDIPF